MFKFIATLIALFTALNSYTVTPVADVPSKEEQHELYADFLKDILKTVSAATMFAKTELLFTL